MIGKRILALFVAAVMAISVLVACQKENNAGTSSPGKAALTMTETTAGAAEVKKPQAIKIWTATFIVPEAGRDQILAEYKKQTGIALEVNQPAYNQYYDLLNLAFASGDVPDAVEMDDQHYLSYAVQGGLADVAQLVDSSATLQRADKSIVDSLKVDGKLYGFPFNNGGGCETMIREDWLKNLGLSIPTTYEEFYELLKKFTFNDPDKNNKDDTVGYTGVLVAGNKLQDQYLRFFYWKASPDFHQVDGKWIDGFAQQDFMDALMRLNKAYKDKVLDQELFTNKTSTCRDKIAAGKAGVMSYWANYWLKRLEDSITQTSAPNGSLAPIAPIKEAGYVNSVPYSTAITSKCKNVEGVFKYFIEYMHDGGKGQDLFCFGVENVHWQMKDGKAEMLPLLNNPEQLFDKVYFSVDAALMPFENPLVPLNSRTVLANKVFFDSGYEQQHIFPASETYVKNMSDIDKLRQEIASKIIIGDLSPEQGLQQYKTEAGKLGVDKILAEFNTAK